MNAYMLKNLKNNNIELTKQEYDNLISDYLIKEKEILYTLNRDEQINYMSSHLNFFDYRNDYDNTRIDLGVGDVCYIDYGISYIRECGYFHLGIIIEIKNNKYLVLPMTSNVKTFEKAIFWKKENLLALPNIKGIEKNTTVFLNDARFINSSRIISKVSSLDKRSMEFSHIRNIFYDYLKEEG